MSTRPLSTTKKLGLASLVAAALGTPASAYGSDLAGILIDFNDYTANSWVYRQAKDTFAVSSTDNGTGQPVPCNGASWCWQYAQPTVDDTNNFYWFYVYDWFEQTGTGQAHYHLGFEDPTMDCYDFNTSGMGRTINGVCTPPADYAAEPRTAYPHHSGGWFVAYPDAWREFYAISIWNRGTVPIQVWVLANDYNWYYIDNLGGQTNWGLTGIPGPFGGFEVDIGTASGYTGGAVFAIDDLKIDYPPL